MLKVGTEDGRACKRNGWLMGVGGTVGESGRRRGRGTLTTGQNPVLSEPALHPQPSVSLVSFFSPLPHPTLLNFPGQAKEETCQNGKTLQ